MIPDIHEPISRNRYAKRNVIKNNIKKSERIYPMSTNDPNAKSFSKNAPEKMRIMSWRSIDKRAKYIKI
jgi:hypothetical protein